MYLKTMETLFGRRLALCMPTRRISKRESKPITRTLMTLTLTCIALFAAPVAANAAGLVVTEPGMLIALGIAFIGVGLGTRKLWTQRRKP